MPLVLPPAPRACLILSLTRTASRLVALHKGAAQPADAVFCCAGSSLLTHRLPSLLVAVLVAAARPVAAADAVVVYELRLRAAGGQVAGARQVGHARAALEVHTQAGTQGADHGVAPAAGHALGVDGCVMEAKD